MATLYVRFPDGTVRYGIYYATIDQPCSRLYDSADEAWEDIALDLDDTGEGEQVELATDYGDGFSWRGTATREEVTCATDEESPNYEEFPGYQAGMPDWAQ